MPILRGTCAAPTATSDRQGTAAARLSVATGWAVAAAALLPGAVAAEAGQRAAPFIGIVAASLWWLLVVWVVRSDLRDFIIPDEASAAIAGLGLCAAAAGPWFDGDGVGEAARSVQGSLATGAGAFAVFWLVGAACSRLGRDALGFGDVKLAGASAVWLAPADAALALEMAALGAIASLMLGRRNAPLRDTAVPFGAFLAPAAWLVFVLGPPLRAAGVLPW